MIAQRPLVSVESLRKLYPVRNGLFARARSQLHAVDGVDFQIARGESLGLVGESGCGKTTTGKLLVKLLSPTEGHIYMDDASTSSTGSPTGSALIDVAPMKGPALRRFRRQVQMIFQDPYESMNPRLTVYDTVAEPLGVQGIGSPAEREEMVARTLALVGLTPPSSFLFRYPHELSGGQRQRVAIARALVMQPSFVVADEPTSMLDVSVRTTIMHLMLDLAERLDVTYLYITHDLAVARYMCQRIAVMYLGKIVELAETEELLGHPQHPYTQALLASVPIPSPHNRRGAADIKGGVSTPIDPAPRCRFYDRCPRATAACEAAEHPPLRNVAAGHQVACRLI